MHHSLVSMRLWGRLLVVGLLGSTSLLMGCGAFEDFRPYPHLREVAQISEKPAIGASRLEIRGKQISVEAAKEVRLVNTVQDVTLEECQVVDGQVLVESLAGIGSLESLSLRRTNVRDEHLAFLAGADKLNSLEIVQTQIKGPGLAALSELPIRSLSFTCLETDAESLQSLASLRHVEEMYLNLPADLAMHKLPSLQALTKLSSLTINRGDYSSEHALDFLAGMSNLTSITISSASINDRTLIALSQLPSLERIDISENKITDAGIESLTQLVGLKDLSINCAEKLTAQCLPSLMKFGQLERVSLSSAPILFEDARVLKSLPNIADVDVGMSRREIAEALEQDPEAYAGLQFDPEPRHYRHGSRRFGNYRNDQF